jgi:hypothetical protein
MKSYHLREFLSALKVLVDNEEYETMLRILRKMLAMEIVDSKPS